jgi:hypothetical protein
MVRRCSSVDPSVDPAQAHDRPGVEEEGLGQRGLARAAVPDECDVADLRSETFTDDPRLGSVVGRFYERVRGSTRSRPGSRRTVYRGGLLATST